MASSIGSSIIVSARELPRRTARRAIIQCQCRRALSASSPRSAELSLQPNPRDLDLQRGNVQDLADVDPIYDTEDISSLAHTELERHREQRKILRTAAWEMPLLSSLTIPYEKPDKSKLPLRWRYTTYMGELHPASRKVVVEFSLDHFTQLTPAQRETFKKVVGTRYNPDKDIVKMSCESFETQAQNRRYLTDKIMELIAYTKDSKNDTFEDLPLDTRHVKTKTRFSFPKEWRLTAERKAQLEARREKQAEQEVRRIEMGKTVDGGQVVKNMLESAQSDPEPVTVAAPAARKQVRK